VDPGVCYSCAIRPSVPSIKRAALLSPNFFPPSFLSNFPLNIIMKIASAESDLARYYNNRHILYANIGLKRTQKLYGNLTTASKSGKRQAYPHKGSRGRRSRYSIMKPY
jgi:hypothetical protein